MGPQNSNAPTESRTPIQSNPPKTVFGELDLTSIPKHIPQGPHLAAWAPSRPSCASRGPLRVLLIGGRLGHIGTVPDWAQTCIAPNTHTGHICAFVEAFGANRCCQCANFTCISTKADCKHMRSVEFQTLPWSRWVDVFECFNLFVRSGFRSE